MRKFRFSIAALMAMSTLAMAGGDVVPVEPVVEVPVVEPSDSGFYVGLAYGLVNTESSIPLNLSDQIQNVNLDIDHDTIMLQAGYQFNTYLAAEARYWWAMGDADVKISGGGESESGDLDDDSSAWGIYLKPMYPVTEAFTAYGLIGYGSVDLELEGESLGDESDFQWGLGASYDINENFAVFVDYVAMFDDDITIEGTSADTEVDSWNFGVTYKF